MKEEIKKLGERALKSLELAKDAFSKEFYEWCIFHVEQFFQLSLKFFLAEKLGYFPAIHGLERLFDEAGKVDKRFIEFFDKNRDALKILEEAYIGSRYLPFDYSKQDAQGKLKLAEEFLEVIKWQ